MLLLGLFGSMLHLHEIYMWEFIMFYKNFMYKMVNFVGFFYGPVEV